MFHLTHPLPVPETPAALGTVRRNLTFTDETPAPPRINHVPKLQKTSRSHASSSPIRVVLRVRPFSEKEQTDGTRCSVSYSATDKTLIEILPSNPKAHPVSIRNAGKAVFRFEQIFNANANQSDVFENTTLPMIEGLFRGKSAVVLAYGVTCSGKTWTIQGNDDHPGILPRSLDVIVNSIACAKGKGLLQDSNVSEDVARLTERGAMPGTVRRTRPRHPKRGLAKEKVHDCNYIEVNGCIEYKIFASYLEVYNEQCYDLFLEQPAVQNDAATTDVDETGAKKENVIDHRRNRRAKLVLKLKKDANGQVYAEGITEIEIQSCADIDRLLEFGQQNRYVASTTANETSSRSHAMFFITLRQTETIHQPTGPPKVLQTTSKLSIVDLAGSERGSRTQNSGIRLMEANKINTSLMDLRRCLQVMKKNQKMLAVDPTRVPMVVPFRHSRLTRLLQNSLESGSAVMIANLSPALYDSDETIHALSNAAIAREVKIAPSKLRVPLKDRSNVLRNVNVNHPITAKNANARAQKMKGVRSIRTRGSANRENKNAGGIAKAKVCDQKDKIIVNMRNELNLLRMKLEEEQIDRLEVEKKNDEMYEENDRLFRHNEKLKDKLADSEARICLVEQEVREEVVDEADKIIKQLQETYQRQIDESWASSQNDKPDRTRVSIVSAAERRENAERLANRVAMRASRAAFDGIKISLAEEEFPEVESSKFEPETVILEDVQDDDYYEEED